MKAKQGKNMDARDMLANKNRILDARQQLQKIKNLKVRNEYISTSEATPGFTLSGGLPVSL